MSKKIYKIAMKNGDAYFAKNDNIKDALDATIKHCIEVTPTDHKLEDIESIILYEDDSPADELLSGLTYSTR